MAEYAIALSYDDDKPQYILLAEEDGLTVTYPDGMDLEDVQSRFDSPKYRAALKRGDFLSTMFSGAYSNGIVRPFTEESRGDYEEVVKEFAKKHPNVRSRFFGA